MADQPFTGEDVEHAIERLKANYYGGDNDYHGLDIDDLDEIVRLVLTSMWERGRLQADPKSVRHCTCGVQLDPAQCGARGMACMGDGEGMPHSPGCRLPADHEGEHSWQRREPVGAFWYVTDVGIAVCHCGHPSGEHIAGTRSCGGRMRSV